MQTSFEAAAPLMSRAVSAASLASLQPSPAVQQLQRLLDAKEVELQHLKAELQRLQLSRPPLRDIGVNTVPWSPASSSSSDPQEMLCREPRDSRCGERSSRNSCSERPVSSMSEAAFSVPSLTSQGSESAANCESMALGESASYWATLAAEVSIRRGFFYARSYRGLVLTSLSAFLPAVFYARRSARQQPQLPENDRESADHPEPAEFECEGPGRDSGVRQQPPDGLQF